MTFQNIRIGRRLGLAFGIVLVLMLIVVVIGANRFAHVQATTKQMVEKEWVKAEAANAINATTRAQARRTMELFLASDSAQRDKIYAHIEANKKIIVAALETLDRLIYLPKGKTLLASIRTEREAYVASFTKVGKLIDAGDVDEAKRVMMGETLPTLDRLQTSVAELAELQEQIANTAAENVSKATTQGTNLLIGLGLGALVIAAVLALLITRSIVRPINNAVNIAKTIAGGDLTSTIDVRYSDETGQLLGALKEMNDSLLRVVSEVRAGTDTVSTASSQIAAGNLDLSSRTEEQASALEETAATMEEITSTVKQNAEHARVANQLASSASSVASRGGEIVAEVVRTMDTIHQSSRKITDITGVIDGIAFQTNILALNAAVEAARAGEQGRGFAVVAIEVRTLAQRASAAAREIKALIENSVEAVDTGCRLVEQAGSTMDEIVVSVRRVTDIMGEISGASDEQTTGISQVNEAVNQMDQVTQQNAALVEESAAAASLEDQAADLARVVATFKLAASERLSDTQDNGPAGRIEQQVRRPAPLAGRRVPRLANAS